MPPGSVVHHWGASQNLSWDLHLSDDSPCIDTANGTASTALDADGNPRVDYPVVGTGVGTPEYVDMGAYENQGPP